MKIYTSYFANIKNLEKRNIYPFAICAYPPNTFRGINLEMLAPSKELLLDIKKNKITEEEYTERYINQVTPLFELGTINNLFQILEKRLGERDIALCCFESPNDFCHRHILAKLINKYLKIEVKEYEEPKSISLF